MDISVLLQQEITIIEKYLDTILPKDSEYPQEMNKAIRYSVFAGGKRIRPVIMRSVCRAIGAAPDLTLPFAAAIEMIHTYSLIHDDLPCMDDDDLRRGKPTNHKVFGEAKALLAGDALLTAAFSIITHYSAVSAEQTIAVIRTLSEAAGPDGMVGGQFMDIDMEHAADNRSADVLEYIHSHKTGALIRAAAVIGGITAGIHGAAIRSISDYGTNLGKAFQIVDDILDVTGDIRSMGKTIGKDAEQEKFTYVSLYGLKRAQEKAQEVTGVCYEILKQLPYDTKELQALTAYLLERVN